MRLMAILKEGLCILFLILKSESHAEKSMWGYKGCTLTEGQVRLFFCFFVIVNVWMLSRQIEKKRQSKRKERNIISWKMINWSKNLIIHIYQLRFYCSIFFYSYFFPFCWIIYKFAFPAIFPLQTNSSLKYCRDLTLGRHIKKCCNYILDTTIGLYQKYNPMR